MFKRSLRTGDYSQWRFKSLNKKTPLFFSIFQNRRNVVNECCRLQMCYTWAAKYTTSVHMRCVRGLESLFYLSTHPCMCNNTKLDMNLKTRLSGRELLRLHCRSMTHVHGGVDLTDGFVVCRELIDLDTVAHQLAHDLYFELVELALGDCVCFGNDGNDVDLQREQKGLLSWSPCIHSSVSRPGLHCICWICYPMAGMTSILMTGQKVPVRLE